MNNIKTFSFRKCTISIIILVLIQSYVVFGQSTQKSSDRNVSINDLKRHSFLYTGEYDYRDKRDQTIFLIKRGKVVWSYKMPFYDKNGVMQELGDASIMPNGNVLFCKKVGASIVTPNKKIVWNIDAEPGCEIHSVQPLGEKKVLVMQNGNPAKLMTIDVEKNKIEKTIILPTGNPKGSHLQFRRVRLTDTGTYLVAHLDNNKVVEYDSEGKEIWSQKAQGAWSAKRLKNGNTLISTYPNTVIEVNKNGDIVWKFGQEDAPEYKFYIFQDVCRLSNGNTVICNWCPGDIKNPKDWDGTVQVLEVTPEKKIVWAVSQWSNPDLGPASSIQILDK